MSLGWRFNGWYATKPEPGESPKVLHGRADYLDSGVGVFTPPHRNILDFKASFFGNDEQLRIEKPVVVDHGGKQDLCRGPAHRLETTLRIAEFRPETQLDNQIIRTGNGIPFE